MSLADWRALGLKKGKQIRRPERGRRLGLRTGLTYEALEERRVLAVSLGRPFEVQATWGKLQGKAGDYLVKDFEDRDTLYPSDVWIVDQKLFAATYEPVGKDR